MTAPNSDLPRDLAPDLPAGGGGDPFAGPPLTVAWVVIGSEGYGVRRCVLTLAGAVAARGWNAVAVSLDAGGLADEWESRGSAIRRIGLGEPPRFAGPMSSKPRELLSARAYRNRAAGAVASALDELGADVVHFVSPQLLAVAGMAARRPTVGRDGQPLGGRPCFWEMPNVVGDRYPLGLNRRLYQWALRRYGVRVLANSAYTAATLGDRPVRPTVFHLGVDAGRFDPDRVEPRPRASLGLPDAAPVFGIFARVNPSKGQLPFLRAMLEVSTDHDAPHLLLLGGPTPGSEVYAADLARVAASAGAPERLHDLGEVTDVERYYGAVDVAVNARVDAEPFGLSVVESMMMGRPVLAHALGGPAETVVDGVTGWHAAPATIEGLSAGLRRALADRQRWPEMGLAARDHAQRHFTADGQAVRYGRLVRRALATR